MADVLAKQIADDAELTDPGDYQFYSTNKGFLKGVIDGVLFKCPCGCGVDRSLQFRRQPGEHPAWDWDANEKSPTLSPSIHIQTGCEWHGHLTKGVFKPV